MAPPSLAGMEILTSEGQTGTWKVEETTLFMCLLKVNVLQKFYFLTNCIGWITVL